MPKDIVDLQNALDAATRRIDQLETYVMPLIRHKTWLLVPTLTANPPSGEAGALALVNGTLKVYTGGAWVTVGTQT
jgi:hypothetical protein